MDLTDGVYQFVSDELASWFSLSFDAQPHDIEDIAGQPFVSTWDDSAGGMVAVDRGLTYTAVSRGLPMGWSWSLCFCHSVLSAAMASASRRWELRQCWS